MLNMLNQARIRPFCACIALGCGLTLAACASSGGSTSPRTGRGDGGFTATATQLPSSVGAPTGAGCGSAIERADTWGSVTKLVAEFTGTGSQVSDWKADRSGAVVSTGDSDAAAARESICVLDGSFDPPLPTPPGVKTATYTRIVVIVSDSDGPYLFQVGTSQSIPPDMPAS